MHCRTGEFEKRIMSRTAITVFFDGRNGMEFYRYEVLLSDFNVLDSAQDSPTSP